jgi:hypothetical protein
VIALVAAFGLLAVPAESQAAPAVFHDPDVAAANLVLVAGGCGRGWHAQRYRDRYGRWRVRCIRNRPSYYYPAPRYPAPRYYYGPHRYY